MTLNLTTFLQNILKDAYGIHINTCPCCSTPFIAGTDIVQTREGELVDTCTGEVLIGREGTMSQNWNPRTMKSRLSELKDQDENITARNI